MKEVSRPAGLPPGTLPALALGALALMALAGALAPTASAGAPPTANIYRPLQNATFEVCKLVEFNATFSSDPDGGPLYYLWQFPNETVEGPSALAFNYANFTQPGDYNITLTVRDNESLEANKTVRITIVPCNVPPVAVIAAPGNGSRFFTDQFINFSAAGSFDPDGGISSFEWFANGLTRGSGMNLSIRLGEGNQNITLVVTDDGGGQGSANITLTVEVNEAPRVEGGSVDPRFGFANDSFTFAFNYSDANGEAAFEAFLVLDGTPHAMALAGGVDPREGQRYAFAMALPAGRHAFYFLATDGNLTNLSATESAPDVFENVTRLSADGLAQIDVAVVPPSTVNVSLWRGAVPPDPAGLVAVSPAYRIDGSALAAANFTLTLGFTPDARVNASSAHILRDQGSDWLSLVTDTDGAAHTARIAGVPSELPATFRVYASRALAPPNAPPVLSIRPTGDFFPNGTVLFDGTGSTDPENATLLLAWRFEGPGLATGWLPGERIRVAFPAAGLYLVELRGEDGSGAPAYKNVTLEIRERPVPPVNVLEEPLTLAALAVAVAVSAVVALWWRARRPGRKKTYEDLYGRLYSGRMNEEKEYTELFEKYADAGEGGAPPEAPESDPPAAR